jgi:hypothetical protein
MHQSNVVKLQQHSANSREGEKHGVHAFSFDPFLGYETSVSVIRLLVVESRLIENDQ